MGSLKKVTEKNAFELVSDTVENLSFLLENFGSVLGLGNALDVRDCLESLALVNRELENEKRLSIN